MAESDIDALPQAKENQVRQAVAAVAASACFLSGVRHRLIGSVHAGRRLSEPLGLREPGRATS